MWKRNVIYWEGIGLASEGVLRGNVLDLQLPFVAVEEPNTVIQGQKRMEIDTGGGKGRMGGLCTIQYLVHRPLDSHSPRHFDPLDAAFSSAPSPSTASAVFWSRR